MTGQRRVDPFAVRYLLDRGRIKQAKVSGQKQEYQRQGRDVNNTRQKSGSQAQVQSSKVGQSGVKHRANKQQDGSRSEMSAGARTRLHNVCMEVCCLNVCV